MIRQFILFAKTPNYIYWNTTQITCSIYKSLSILFYSYKYILIYIYIYNSPLYIQLFIEIGEKHLGDKGVKNISCMLKYNQSLRTLHLGNYYYYLYIIHSEYRG